MEKEKKVTRAAITKTPNIEKERIDFKKLILKNPNYFNTFPELKIKPVTPMKSNTKYEELTCIGFYPETDLLEAIIQIKLPYGYNGDLCSAGSFEYVRFFIDWNGNGNFEASEDAGIASVNVHDIPDSGYTCLDKTKPISYALTLKIDSKKKPCTLPNLVKVRAILSWNLPPPTGNPDFTPPWGNIVEKWIQIKPVKLLLKDVIKAVELEKLKLTPAMLDLDIEVTKAPKLSVTELKKLYAGENIPEHRFNIEEISQSAEKIKQNPALMVQYKLNPSLSQFIESVEAVLAEKPNVKFEELRCVGLNYDLDTLVATLVVKLPCGYSGGLCTQGSYEYVAFWAYVYDQIEQMCYWRYLGTSSVNVHDIKNLPKDGLQYAVSLPYDFSNYKNKCSKPKVLKIRAILSWNTPPPTSNPNYSPVWGNTVDALIQLKPLSVDQDQQVPFISVVGGMAVESISGNTLSVVPSSLGDGYANGPSVYGGFSALESPFGGVIAICGHISNPPNDPAPAGKLKYKVQFKKTGQPNWQDITNTFKIWISQWNGLFWSMSSQNQIATGGYYTYEEDLTPPNQRFVEGDVLAQWHTPVAEGDGLYEIRMLLYKPGAPAAPGVPADHVASNIVKVRVDNTRPNAAVSLDIGPCAKITIGETITGTFTATDPHIANYSISIEPATANPPTFLTPSPESYPAMPAPGRTDWPFEIQTTAATTPCGYVIKVHVWDRAIINNSRPGNYNSASVGLCLLETKK
ncbi:MAG: hypothetical protein NWE94_07340 [Candidatus Bathyarchaeota archaeon]|nr:hypothetical protein [Candidatus Bathyarchaeota archaeon]